MEKILVTAYCLTYNHEKYIKKTLDGFVMQKTNFKYKVIVHDDASTDNTKNIILEYKNKYPDIFITIFQSVNQYSQKVDIFKKFVLPKINSKYIAVCEGDDYWLNENKLQMQVDYMEKNPKCSLCGHNSLIINENGTSTKHNLYHINEEKNYYTKEIILADGGGAFHTSSFLYRHSDIIDRNDDFYIYGIGDYSLKIFLSLKGYLHYFPNVFSAHRKNVPGSWTLRTFRNQDNFNDYNNTIIKGLQKMNIITNLIYDNEFKIRILKYNIQKHFHNGEILEFLSNKNLIRVWFKHYNFKQKIKMVISIFYHRVFKRKIYE